jgi:dephospho-CoA kinase
MYKIGLTGGICTGKTFVLNIFKELDCYTIRADDIAKNLIFSSNSKILKEIIKVFGEGIYDEKSGLKKEEFTKILFEDMEKRNFINNMVHPLVKTERDNIIQGLEKSNVYDFFVYESALLVESGTYKDFDKIMIAYTTPEEQVRRLMKRDGISIEEAEARIKAQFPLSEKLKVANYTIDTTGTFEEAKAKTLESFHLMKKDLKMV